MEIIYVCVCVGGGGGRMYFCSIKVACCFFFHVFLFSSFSIDFSWFFYEMLKGSFKKDLAVLRFCKFWQVRKNWKF